MTHEENTGSAWQVELSLAFYDPKTSAAFFINKEGNKYFAWMEQLQEITLKLGRRVKKHTDIFLCTVEEDPNGKGPKIVSFDRLPDK